MEKLIFCNLDMLKSELDKDDYKGYDFSNFDYERFNEKRIKFIRNFIELSEKSDNSIYFYSRKRDVLRVFADKSHKAGYTNFQFKDRKTVEEFVKSHKNKNNYFVFVGGKNADFTLAVNTRSLYIVPTWLPLEDRAQRYGIPVNTVKQLRKFIQTLNNQNVWYSRLEIDAISTAYSLLDARYGKYANTEEEKMMVRRFQKLLKDHKSLNSRRILLYHFLAGMTSNMEFDDIELFGMIPSSNCDVNKYVFDFMTQVRLLKGKPLPKRYKPDVPAAATNLLIRHEEKDQNHNGGREKQARINLGAKDEFRTLIINPDYKKRIDTLRRERRFNVCIFDDYMTHGNSFNAVRNLLEKLGANKIIFVSIGVFLNKFQKRDYTITGDVFSPGYTYQLETYQPIGVERYEINRHAKQEVANLLDIFNS